MQTIYLNKYYWLLVAFLLNACFGSSNSSDTPTPTGKEILEHKNPYHYQNLVMIKKKNTGHSY